MASAKLNRFCGIEEQQYERTLILYKKTEQARLAPCMVPLIGVEPIRYHYRRILSADSREFSIIINSYFIAQSINRSLFH